MITDNISQCFSAKILNFPSPTISHTQRGEDQSLMSSFSCLTMSSSSSFSSATFSAIFFFFGLVLLAASGLAGDVLLKDQEVYLEFDAGKSIGDILHSSKWLEDFFEAISFKLWIHLHPQVFADISGIASNLGAPDNILLALGSLGIFSSAGINLNFKSATELPEDIKSSLRKIESRANFAEIHQKTPAGLKAFFGHFANHGTGNLHLFGSLQTNAVQIDLHIPGLSKFISEQFSNRLFLIFYTKTVKKRHLAKKKIFLENLIN